MRLGARDDGVPDHVGAGGKTQQRVGHHGVQARVVGFDLITRVAQQQRAPRGGWQEFAYAFKAVFAQHRDLPPRLELGNIGR